MPLQFDRISIIGVGLIGGSFGMAVKKRGLVRRVTGIGRNRERLEQAVRLGAIDDWSLDLQTGVAESDLLYVSTPVGTEVGFIEHASDVMKPGSIITDAGSTKAAICAAADELAGSEVSFIGGHPMAGSEIAGVEAADADLFEGAAYVLTPTDRTDGDALNGIHTLAESIGSRVMIMDPATHDRCVAVISHLPHLMAAALVNLAQERSKKDNLLFDMIAGSFRDMTRVAGSSPELWRDICLSNESEIALAIRDFFSELGRIAKILESGDERETFKWFETARNVRESILIKAAPGVDQRNYD
jgi:prephenate dehydrogenase